MGSGEEEFGVRYKGGGVPAGIRFSSTGCNVFDGGVGFRQRPVSAAMSRRALDFVIEAASLSVASWLEPASAILHH